MFQIILYFNIFIVIFIFYCPSSHHRKALNQKCPDLSSNKVSVKDNNSMTKYSMKSIQCNNGLCFLHIVNRILTFLGPIHPTFMVTRL